MAAIVIYQRSPVRVPLFTLVLAVAVASASLAGSKKKQPASPKPKPSTALIEVTGSILGVKLFAPLEEAREKLAHLKLEQDSTPEEAEKGEREAGERIVWRLTETEYQWIVAWADKEGKVVKISASVRPDKKKPFSEIGDLSRAKVHTDSMAMWSVQRPNGSNYRLIAKGPAEHAITIYMYSLKAEERD